MVLPLARNVKHGRRLCSDNAVSAQKLRLIAVTWAATLDPFISPAHLTRLERWPLPEGSLYEAVAYCDMSHYLTLRSNGKTLKFRLLFVIRVQAVQ